jgi:hypothetical protein
MMQALQKFESYCFKIGALFAASLVEEVAFV